MKLVEFTTLAGTKASFVPTRISSINRRISMNGFDVWIKVDDWTEFQTGEAYESCCKRWEKALNGGE